MLYDQYYLSYSGISLPLKLVSSLDSDSVENRNTYFAAKLDDHGRVVLVHKIIYGEIALEHRYTYYENGTLQQANIVDEEGESRLIEFDSAGKILTT